MSKTILQKEPETGRWVRGTDSGGMCFTVSPARFEEILKSGKLPSAFPNWKLGKDEFVEKLVFDASGITVYVGKHAG